MADERDLWTLSETRRLRMMAEETSRRSAELKDESHQARVDREQTQTRARLTRNPGRRRNDEAESNAAVCAPPGLQMR
jgi:hypothetical protein